MNDWDDAERRVERAQELFEQRRWQEALEELRAANEEIVVPGKLTTAFLVLKMALGGEFPCRVLPFDRILAEVASGAASAGLLIHAFDIKYYQLSGPDWLRGATASRVAPLLLPDRRLEIRIRRD